MQQFCSMRSNKWQHIAQTLRFEWPSKQGIIEIAPNRVRFLDIHGPLDGG